MFIVSRIIKTLWYCRFYIVESTGEVHVAVEADQDHSLLDRELISSHYLTIEAIDGGGLRTAVQLHIQLLDVNDNAPTISFPRSGDNNTFAISTQVPVGYRILTVQAADMDDGINSELTYAISEGNEYGEFIIEPRKGELLVNKDLSLHDGSSFPLIVTVNDNGASRQHTAVSTLTVLVDQNVLYPDPAFSSEATSGLGLSSTHLAVVVCVVVGSFLVAMFLVVAILVVRRRGKQGKSNNSTQQTFYMAKSADVIPNTGAGHEGADEQYNNTDAPYNEHITSKVSSGDIRPLV